MSWLKNNRFRKNWGKIYQSIKKERRLYGVIWIVAFILGIYFASWAVQAFGKMIDHERVLHLFNPIFALYYGLFQAPGVTIFAALLIGCVISYKKLYIDVFDYEYDPRGFAISPNGTYGTNRIMSENEERNFIKTGNISEISDNIIGKTEDGLVKYVFNNNGLGPHKFVCGASGSWKTSSQFIPDMMQIIIRKESMICTDPKGELRSTTYRMAQNHGYITREFNLINPILSDACDFMKLVETYGDARTFTEIIMSNTSGDAMHMEDFWAKGERAAICFGIMYVKEAAEYDGERTFANVFKFLKKDLEEISAKASALPEGSLAKSQWEIFLTTPDNSKGGIMTGVATRLEFLNDPTIANITGRDEIDITLPGKKPCIYYVLMSDQESTNNVIASIFFSFLFIKLAKMADARLDQKLEVPVNFQLEEMPNIGKIPDFPKKLSTIRSRNMCCTICVQDIGQMQNMYPTIWQNIISNCDRQVMLGCNDSDITAPFFSNSYGEMTTIVETERTSAERFRAYSADNIYQKNVGDGRRMVFTPGEIMGLDNKYALVRFRGHNVMKVLKFSYFDHPMYKEIQPENANGHRPQWWDDIIAAQNKASANGQNYDWFSVELERLDQIQREQNRELMQKEKENARIADECKVERVANGQEDESSLNAEEKKKLTLIRLRRKWNYFKQYLHGVTDDAGSTYTQEDDPGTVQERVDAAFTDTGISDNAVITQNNERENVVSEQVEELEGSKPLDDDTYESLGYFAFDEPEIPEPEFDEPEVDIPVISWSETTTDRIKKDFGDDTDDDGLETEKSGEIRRTLGGFNPDTAVKENQARKNDLELERKAREQLKKTAESRSFRPQIQEANEYDTDPYGEDGLSSRYQSGVSESIAKMRQAKAKDTQERNKVLSHVTTDTKGL